MYKKAKAAYEEWEEFLMNDVKYQQIHRQAIKSLVLDGLTVIKPKDLDTGKARNMAEDDFQFRGHKIVIHPQNFKDLYGEDANPKDYPNIILSQPVEEGEGGGDDYRGNEFYGIPELITEDGKDADGNVAPKGFGKDVASEAAKQDFEIDGTWISDYEKKEPLPPFGSENSKPSFCECGSEATFGPGGVHSEWCKMWRSKG